MTRDKHLKRIATRLVYILLIGSLFFSLTSPVNKAYASCNSVGGDCGCKCSCGSDRRNPRTACRCNWTCCVQWFGSCGCSGWGTAPCCNPGACTGCTPATPSGYTATNTGCSTTTNSCTGNNGCSSCTINKTFWLLKYTVTFSAGTGGTITGTSSQSICRGSNSASVTATPNAGYHFTNWSDGNTNATRNVTSVTSNQSRTAYFAVSNVAPSSPSGLLTDSQTNPSGIINTLPQFSAIFNDPDSSDTGIHYQIQVNTQSNFSGTTLWDSGKTSLTTINNGTRSSNITYAGTPLSLDGSTYYWRIKFWDNSGAEGTWSSASQFKLNSTPSSPSTLHTQGQENPIGIVNGNPTFSAIFQDPDVSDTGNHYQIQVNTLADFNGTMAWDSGLLSISSVTNGSRSPNFTYGGSSLQLDGSTYHWRIRFADNQGTVSDWSSVNSFTMNTPPSKPTNLLINGEVNPQKVITTVPKFSARFEDPNNTDHGETYQIQINTQDDFNGTMVWDSTISPIDNITNGQQSSDITYIGDNIPIDGSTYFWRIRFSDNYGTVSDWSDISNFTMNAQPTAPTELLLEGETNPSKVYALEPSFSAICNDPDSEDTCTHFQIQVNSLSDFTGIEMWDSGKQSLSPSKNPGERSSNIPYAGTAITHDRSTYFWRIKFWDDLDSEGIWSDTNQFTMLSVPEAPTILEATPLSTSSIRWNFEDNSDIEEGFVILDTNDDVIKTCEGENLTYCDEEGLEENEEYVRKIAAYNIVGTGSASLTESTHTKISAPSVSVGGSVTTNSIPLQVNGRKNNNPVRFECVGENCNSGINQWLTENQTTATNLQPNTSYTFRAKAKNNRGIETDFSETITVNTLAETPSINTTAISPTRIQLEANDINNIDQEDSGIYFECEESDCLEGIGQWSQTDTAVVENLSPNTQYFFRVKAKNKDGIQTEPSSFRGIYTLSNIPSRIQERSKETNQLTITLGDDGNPLNTQYFIQETTSGKYVDPNTNNLVDTPVWGTKQEFGMDSGIAIAGLESGTQYIFKVKAKNGDDIETNFSETFEYATKLKKANNLKSSSVNTNSVKWSVEDSNENQTGYKIYNEKDELIIVCTDQDSFNNCFEQNLDPNTKYFRKVEIFNDVSQSDKTDLISFVTHSNPSNIKNVSSPDPESVVLNIEGSSRDNIQVLEETTGQYLDGSLEVLKGGYSTSIYKPSLSVYGLKPNTLYRFKVRSLNSENVATQWSKTIELVTKSKKPSIVKIDDLSSSSVRVYINNSDNPTNTQISVRESNSGKYLDFRTGLLVDTEVWGTITDFGGTNGIIVKNLRTGNQYGFSSRSKNLDELTTEWSEGAFIGTTAKLRNVKQNLNVVLANNTSVPVTTQGQYGEKRVRIQQGNTILAEIPVLFSEDRDWSDAIVLSSQEEKKTVVKLQEKHGVLKPYTMYVLKGDTNAFLLCPNAQTLEQVSPDCEGGVNFTGPYPETKAVEGNSVTVSQTVLSSIEYWVADGLTGTGGQGYIEDKPTTGENSNKLEEEKQSETKISNNEITNAVRESIETINTFIKNNTLGIIDNTPIKDLNAEELKQVSATATVVTVTIGTTTMLGGLTQLAYSITQAVFVFLSALGFRKRRINYGFVYDSNTKEPVQLAMVRIFQNEKLIETAVTDNLGRFSGSLEPGIYQLEVTKPKYEFPSAYITGTSDYPIQNVYSGSLVIKSEDTDIQIAVPIDPKTIKGLERTKHLIKNSILKTLYIINILIFITGSLISLYSYYTYPDITTLVIVLLYIFPLYILLKSIFNNKGRYGKVVDSEGKAIVNVSVLIKENAFDRVIAKRVTDQKGKYRFIMDAGEYSITIEDTKYQLQKEKILNIKKNNFTVTSKLVAIEK